MKTKIKELFNLKTLGILLAVIACVIFWLPCYEYTETKFFFGKTTKHLNLTPDLISGLIALGLTFILYVRNIISFNIKDNKILTLISFIVNLTLFTTIIQIFVSPGVTVAKKDAFVESTVFIVGIAVCVAILLFGVKEIAKLVLLALVGFLLFMNLKLVNDAMGTLGYIVLILILASFYLQENIKMSELETNVKYLFSSDKVRIVDIDKAENEFNSIKENFVSKIETLNIEK